MRNAMQALHWERGPARNRATSTIREITLSNTKKFFVKVRVISWIAFRQLSRRKTLIFKLGH